MASDDQISGPPSPSDALVEALRALVREELKRPSPTATSERPPTWRDGFWLLVLIVNVGLFVTLIPEEWWKSPALEVPGKILPWLGGGTFILGATWFRERLLAFSRSHIIKVPMAVALVPLLLLHVRFIPLRPRIDPPDSAFFIADTPQGEEFQLQEGKFQGETRIWLRLGYHRFKIQQRIEGVAGEPPGKTQTHPDQSSAAIEDDRGRASDRVLTEPRVIEWNWTRLLASWLGNAQPHWSPLYWVTVLTLGEQCKVHIKPVGQFDVDFKPEQSTTSADLLEFNPQAASDKLLLPLGSYSISVDKTGCETLRIPKAVSVPLVGDTDTIDLSKMKCQTP